MDRPGHLTLALDKYLQLVRRRKWVLLAPMLLAVIGGMGVTLWMPKVYEASATARIALAGGAANGWVDPREAETLANTYAQILYSRPVLASVIAELGLDIAPGELQRRAKAEVLAGTELIRITAEAGSPEEARAVANALASALVEEGQAFYTRSGTPSLAESFSVVETALLPKSPAQPSLPMNMGIALLVGLAAGIGLALALEYADATLKRVEDLAQITPLPVLGSVSRGGMPLATGPIRGRRQEMTSSAPASAGYGLLAANLRPLLTQQQLRSILLTSAWPEEGTTSAAVATAIALAQGGVDVLLVDANLHNPRLHSVFDLPDQPGLTHVLLASFNGSPELRESLAAAVRPAPTYGLSVLTSGSDAGGSPELLASVKMRKLIELFNSFRTSVTIIDGPPLLQSGYAAALVPQVGGVVLVCAEGIADADSVERTLEQLQNVGGNVLGLVYNKALTR